VRCPREDCPDCAQLKGKPMPGRKPRDVEKTAEKETDGEGSGSEFDHYVGNEESDQATPKNTSTMEENSQFALFSPCPPENSIKVCPIAMEEAAMMLRPRKNAVAPQPEAPPYVGKRKRGRPRLQERKPPHLPSTNTGRNALPQAAAKSKTKMASDVNTTSRGRSNSLQRHGSVNPHAATKTRPNHDADSDGEAVQPPAAGELKTRRQKEQIQGNRKSWNLRPRKCSQNNGDKGIVEGKISSKKDPPPSLQSTSNDKKRQQQSTKILQKHQDSGNSDSTLPSKQNVYRGEASNQTSHDLADRRFKRCGGNTGKTGKCPSTGRPHPGDNDGTARVDEIKELESGEWIRPMTTQEWREAQLRDKILGKVIELKRLYGLQKPPGDVTKGLDSTVKYYCTREWKTLTFVDDVLSRVRREKLQPDEQDEGQEGDLTIQRVVPKELRRGIFEMVHASQLGGHLGFDKVFPLASHRFFWAGMAGDFKTWLKSCHACAENKPGPGRAKLPLHQDISEAVLQRIALDIAGPMETTPRGNRFVLVIQDYFSKWVEIYPIPNHTAETVAKCVVNYICHYGCPERLHSDRGTELTSYLFRNLCKLFNIKKTYTTSYCPWSDGGVERMNRSWKLMLNAFTKAGDLDWDNYMEPLAAAYRATVHASTGFSPNMMTFGQELNHPVDLVYGKTGGNHPMKDAPTYVQNLKENLQKVWSKARLHLKKSAETQQKSHCRDLVEWDFKVGDLVYKRLPRGAKISKKWQGPCTITAVISQWLIEIEYKNRRHLINANNLKPFREVKPEDLAP
jgi:hypothetical protein